MDIEKLIEQAVELAKTAAAVVPGLQPVGKAVEIGEKIVGLIDDLTDHAPDPRSQEEMRAARAELAEKVKAKAEATADRLEGDG